MIPENQISLRLHGDGRAPLLVYLPGMHGDWTLLAPFRAALAERASLLEITYPHRPDWSLQQYAEALRAALLERGFRQGWLLAESFSSQVAWKYLALAQASESAAAFQVEGLILVGGFIRHPWIPAVRLAGRISRAVPPWFVRAACQFYARLATRRHGACPGAAREFQEFVAHRTTAADRQTINARYQLIIHEDLRPTAQATRLPVFQLSGVYDPIVPWWPVRSWLRRHCPGFRASSILSRANHNVSLSAPTRSAGQILSWIASISSGQPSRSAESFSQAHSE